MNACISSLSLHHHKWMLCPDCKCRICFIDKVYASYNNVPMIKLRCECNNKQFFNISLNDYIQYINKAHINKCQICDTTHDINHIKHCYKDLFMTNKCDVHNDEVCKYYCEKCNEHLCECCLNERHNKSEHCVVMLNQLWDKTCKELMFKNTEEINKFFEREKEKIKKYKNNKITMLNNMIGVIEKKKLDIEK